MTNQEQTEFNRILLERVELLEKKVKGLQEENLVLLEDRWPAKVTALPGVREYNPSMYMTESMTRIEVRNG